MARNEYLFDARRIAGTHREKLDQIDDAIDELLEIKRLECFEDQPSARFVAVRRQTHWVGMVITVLVLLLALALLLAKPLPAAGPRANGLEDSCSTSCSLV